MPPAMKLASVAVKSPGPRVPFSLSLCACPGCACLAPCCKQSCQYIMRQAGGHTLQRHECTGYQTRPSQLISRQPSSGASPTYGKLLGPHQPNRLCFRDREFPGKSWTWQQLLLFKVYVRQHLSSLCTIDPCRSQNFTLQKAALERFCKTNEYRSQTQCNTYGRESLPL